ILFNNAGITGHCPLKDVTYEQWRKIMKVNLDGMFFVAQEVGNVMIAKRNGKIINTASMSGFIINKKRYNGVYCISKAGVIMLTKALAAEWSEYNINVNAIAPGSTKTPLVKKLLESPEKLRELEELTPMNRLAEVEEIAGTVLFLASPEASYITGETIKIDGGYTIW
ncbi:MAG: hypothetical protein PWR10_2411, partial [Halanaerobiales bacterium]|nr:hypothetical protein [Halanaerobiales bacterium]